MKKLLRTLFITFLFLQVCLCTALAKDQAKDEPYEFTIACENISLKNGTYSFSLIIRSDRTLKFDNNLEISYQGIEGCYSLNYEIDETDNHLMTVNGTFNNIITSSPLLDRVSADLANLVVSLVSDDSYSYQLSLNTQKGFTFKNQLKFLFNSRPYSFSVSYTYDKTVRQKLLKGLTKTRRLIVR